MIVHSSKFVPAKPACPGIVLLSRAKPKPERASVVTKAGRLRRELTAWLKRGAPLVPKEVRQARLAICRACEYYDAAGNLGLGECRFPGCGCTRVKAALATSRCPHKPAKWAPWVPPETGSSGP